MVTNSEISKFRAYIAGIAAKSISIVQDIKPRVKRVIHLNDERDEFE